MRRVFLIFFGVFLFGLPVFAQYEYSSKPAIPEVNINDRSITLQNSLFPEYYQNNSASSDMHWVQRHDSDLTAFWYINGQTILETLSRLSGIDWQEPAFDIYFVRYYTDIGEGEPIIIPLGGIKQKQLTEVSPDGCRMQLNLIFQLARRMLAQTLRPEKNIHYHIADHPLMRPGPFRRDNLAMLLALVTGQNVMGLDSTYNAFQSAFWQQHFLGREIFNQYLLNEWILSSNRTLAMWLSEEPYNSRLVLTTHPPRVTTGTNDRTNRFFIEGLPSKGQLGFSVKFNENNRLEVDQIDINRLAFACGLRQGDEIRLVDGLRPVNQKDLIEKILAGLQHYSATVQIVRQGQNQTVLIRPMNLSPSEDSLFWNEPADTIVTPDYLPDDTVIIKDSLIPDSSY